jgi:hypothetical protein
MSFESENAQGYHRRKDLQYLELKLARITRVDWDKMTCDIRYLQDVGGRTKVAFSTAYWSYQAFMGVVPEEGTAVVVGFYHGGANNWMPVILGYLPASPKAARRVESMQVGLPPEGEDDEARSEFSFVQRMRLRKMYPGQVLLSSREGSDVILSDDILLSNAANNEILLRNDDQAIVLNSVLNVMNVPGGFVRFGPITRNDYVLDEHIRRSGQPIQDSTDFDEFLAAHLGDPITLPNGKKVNFICDIPANPNRGGNPFTEHRVDIYEFNQLTPTMTEDTELFPVSGLYEYPLVQQIMGTVVGSNPDDLHTYARVLKASVHRNIHDPKGVWRFEEAVRAGGVTAENEIRSAALAYYLKVGGYHQGITKTGNVYISMPASTQAGPMGEGHSLNADLAGGAKVSLGKEKGKGNSIYLNAEGSVTAFVGKGQVDEQGAKGRSVEITTQGGISVEATGADEDNYSMTTVLANKEYRDIGGDYDLTVKGNYNLTIHGVINEQILGKKVEQYIGDRNVNVGGSMKETIIEKKQLMLGQGRSETIASGGTSPNADTLTILAGNKMVTVTLGNVVETVAAGNYIETITAGNKAVNIATGTFNVSVGTGAVTVTTGSGAISITTASGAMTLTATGVVQITGGVINVTGGSVNLGSVPIGGVVTSAHPCLVTGAPHIGSLTVRAAG